MPAYTITFDGGALGNPGIGYGSYAISQPGRTRTVTRLRFSDNGEIVTNNQAEYRTLIAALEELIDRLGPDARNAAVTVRGDSKLVIEQVAGRWKVKNVELKSLCQRAGELMAVFGKTHLVWQPRAKSVGTLGH
jgi:probable phosphoglycerate mutase